MVKEINQECLVNGYVYSCPSPLHLGSRLGEGYSIWCRTTVKGRVSGFSTIGLTSQGDGNSTSALDDEGMLQPLTFVSHNNPW